MTDAFGNVVGHADVTRRLAGALTAGRLPHGLLFVGRRGVGRRTVADALAVAFLGGKPDVARRVAAGTHADFHVVTRDLIRRHDATGKSKGIDLSVKVIRPELVEPANRASVEGVGKVFVVEEAETMTTGAQNALLRTLEEPPGRTLIVLLADSAEGLLPTVRSRCQTFRFGDLTRDESVTVLGRSGVSPRDADAAYAVAGGSPGLAGEFLERGVVAEVDTLAALLESPGDDLPAFLTAAAEAHAKSELERDPLASKDALTRGGYRLWLGLAASHYRRRLANNPSPDVCDRIEAVVLCDRYLDANVNVSLALRNLALSL